MSLVLAAIALAIWIYLLTARGAFWRARERDDSWPQGGDPPRWPDVVAIVPARDEAPTVGACVTSLLRQDYPGDFTIILVDDESGVLRRRGPPHGAGRRAAPAGMERQSLGDEPGARRSV